LKKCTCERIFCFWWRDYVLNTCCNLVSDTKLKTSWFLNTVHVRTCVLGERRCMNKSRVNERELWFIRWYCTVNCCGSMIWALYLEHFLLPSKLNILMLLIIRRANTMFSKRGRAEARLQHGVRRHCESRRLIVEKSFFPAYPRSVYRVFTKLFVIDKSNRPKTIGGVSWLNNIVRGARAIFRFYTVNA